MKRKTIPKAAQLIQRYIETNSINQTKFSLIAEVPQGMVSYWVQGKRPVSPRAALAIEKNTDGKLSRFDLCPTVFQRNSAA